MEEILYFLVSSFVLLNFAEGFKLKHLDGIPLQEENNEIMHGGLPVLEKELNAVPDEVVTHKGGHLVLSCEAGGSPTPTIHWLFNGVRQEQNGNVRIEDEEAFYENNAHNDGMPTLRIGSTKSKLFIDCISEAQAGEYACVADEPTKRATKVTHVRVESNFAAEDVLLSCLNKRQHAAYKPARVYMWTANRLEIEGADVQLFCRAEGTPRPSITWVQLDKNDNVIPIDPGQHEVLENGDLFVREINFIKNMGTYRCIAENEHGKDEADSFLYPTAFGKK